MGLTGCEKDRVPAVFVGKVLILKDRLRFLRCVWVGGGGFGAVFGVGCTLRFWECGYMLAKLPGILILQDVRPGSPLFLIVYGWG
jgi:hypothetical protein